MLVVRRVGEDVTVYTYDVITGGYVYQANDRISGEYTVNITGWEAFVALQSVERLQ